MSAVKLLVVDDEADLRHLVRQRFRRQVRDGAYAFSYAADGEEALDFLRADPAIDIVLTDINMPRMDGLTLLSRLGDLDRMLMPIVISAYGDMDNIRTAMNRGSFDFLTKPIDMQDLDVTIEKAVQMIQRMKTAAQVRETFGRYLSPELIEEVMAQSGELQLGGEVRVVSLLMSDLRGFSSLTATLPAERVVEMLNLYLGRRHR
jgi:adenylate cyclase